MTRKNPWTSHATYEHCTATVSFTAAQFSAFKQLQQDLGLRTDGQVLQVALRVLFDTHNNEGGEDVPDHRHE